MGSLSNNSESGVSSPILDFTSPLLESEVPELVSNSDPETLDLTFSRIASTRRNLEKQGSGFSLRKNGSLQKKVFLEGYVDAADEDDQSSVSRTKSLTDEDLDELKGCVDLGFGFNYDEIPELCNTLPALELCYSMSQKFLDEQQKSPDAAEGGASQGPVANWKISSPGDHPEEVKARLKFWAQAVACTVRLCS